MPKPAPKAKFSLNKLFGSTARVKLLKLFLVHPNEKYYIRQLSRDLGLQLNSVRRELENLESFGILTSDIEKQSDTAQEMSSVEEFLAGVKDPKKAKKSKKTEAEENGRNDKKYFQANQNFILFNEIKALFVKSQILYEKDFVDKIQDAGRPKLLILTGFFVNNDKAQVDLFVVGKLSRERLLKQITELESELGREINYTIMDPREFKYRRDITDVFLYEILEGKKVVVIDEYGIQ